ncbi:hypothetical protein AGMMS49587_12040 [Spirochaetia bacterium]|nr:hypothetical protein AGMMS49587_12040 [Spirochaetia bacterium]
MNKKPIFSAMALAFGLVIIGCATTGNGTGSTGTPPKVIGFYTQSSLTGNPADGKFEPKTNFSIKEIFYFNVQIDDPDRNVKKAVIVLKQDGVPYSFERKISQSSNPYTLSIGAFHFQSSGKQTAEIHVIDSKGNESNTAVVDIIID